MILTGLFMESMILCFECRCFPVSTPIFPVVATQTVVCGLGRQFPLYNRGGGFLLKTLYLQELYIGVGPGVPGVFPDCS
jgi:hypothetical protein